MINSKLSSDILESQFGPTKVNILFQNSSYRVIQTIAIKTGQILEMSLVRFVVAGINAFPDQHKSILSGKSMGKVFRDSGILFQRREQFAGYVDVPKNLHSLLGGGKQLLVVGVGIYVGPNNVLYANITETYRADVIWPKLFGKPTQQILSDIKLLEENCVRNSIGLNVEGQSHHIGTSP